jgi:hypothetical protein
MSDFLGELKKLLNEANGAIIRSAIDGDLVVSLDAGEIEYTFNEDITAEAIEHGWFKESWGE